MPKSWKIIPRPLMESILNSHAAHHRVPQPLILHGPRGVGKTTLLLERLLENWNRLPHVTAYVDFASAIEGNTDTTSPRPWTSWCASPECRPALSDCVVRLENCLEDLARKGVGLGLITSSQIFSTLNKWHRLETALLRLLDHYSPGGLKSRNVVKRKPPASVLWDRAVFVLSSRSNVCEINELLGLKDGAERKLTMEEASYFREAMVALKLAKEVLDMQLKWRENAISSLNKTNGFSRPLANACTNWPCLLIELLSQSAEVGHFQPKLVLNNIEILKHAVLTDDTMVSGPLYHDSLLWRIIALGVNERCLPVVLITSDSYYSYRAFVDYGFPDIFVSRETFGWTPKEAEMHLVPNYFSVSEWKLMMNVLGPNSRHLSELYTLKQSSYYEKVLENRSATFEDILDVYLAHLQVSVVNPAMDKALTFLLKFAKDVREKKISDSRRRFGSAWRHPPKVEDLNINSEWAKLQLMDFIQSLVNAGFGVNYFFDPSLEIMDDPCTDALLEVGLLYAQRDPSFLRPTSIAIQRCLVRWLVQERLNLSFPTMIRYLWHRFIRGRYYIHLVHDIGYEK